MQKEEFIYRLQEDNVALRATQMVILLFISTQPQLTTQRLDSSPPLNAHILGSSFTPSAPLNINGRLLLQSPGFFGTSAEEPSTSPYRTLGLFGDTTVWIDALSVPGVSRLSTLTSVLTGRRGHSTSGCLLAS